MTVREGRWDCQYCGTKGVLGRHKSCQVCFAARPAGTRFYLPKDADIVKDVELLGYAQKGPDWVCAFCGSSNSADIRICTTCQSERSVDAHTQLVKEYQPGYAPTTGDMSFDDSSDSSGPREKERGTLRPQPTRSRIPTIVGGVVLLAICLLGLLFVGRFFSSSEVTAAVDRFEWERTVEIEELQTVVESDWQLPLEATLLDQEEQIRTYDEVLAGYVTEYRDVADQVYVGDREYVCGQNDLGNGFFEDVYCSEPIYETEYRTEPIEVPVYESVPVYGTFYTYEVDKWVVVRTERSTGSDQDAAWPVYELGEFEREGDRYESYAAVFIAPSGDSYRLDFPYQRWASLIDDGDYALEVDGFGEVQGLVNQ